MIGAISAADVSNDTLAFSDDDVIGDISSNAKEIYVNDTGDDSNIGSVNSPYATISKAINDVNSSDVATIYLSEGTFGSDNDSDLNINLNHKVDGGSLTIIGAGVTKTFIDGQSAFSFATLGSETNITLKNISFINFKSSMAGVIWDYGGILTIEKCVFKDSFTTSTKGGAIYIANRAGVLTVKDSEFISCSVKGSSGGAWDIKGGGAIYANNIANLILENNLFVGTTIATGNGVAVYTNSKSYISGNKFINLTGTNDASIYTAAPSSTIINNEFINCSSSSTTYSILTIASGKHDLKNNTFVNSTNSVGNIYAGGTISELNITMASNVISIDNAEINNGVEISVSVKDDMGNVVKANSFRINFVNENNSYVYSPTISNGKTLIKFNSLPEVGIYNVTIIYGGVTGDVLTTADIHYSNEPVELYVSPEGDDGNEGDYENPLATIQQALDVGFEKTYNVTIHLLEGTYSGDGNVELDISNKGTLQIIGEKYGETIIDGNYENWFLNVNTVSTIKNLKFINGYSCDYNLISGNYKLSLENCIFDENTAEDVAIISNVNMDKIIYTNNNGYSSLSYSSNFQQYTIINDSYFAGNTNLYGSGGVFNIGNNRVIIENCKFINNTAGENGGVIDAYSGFITKNNYFEGNTAVTGGVIYCTPNTIITFDNNTFVNNHAINSGVIGSDMDGVEVFQFPALMFNDCKFINNSATNGGVAILKVGIFNGCSFINNTADYGGAIVLYPYCIEPEEPIYIDYDTEEMLLSLELNDVIFQDNTAKVNGNDIYLNEKDDWYWDEDYAYHYAIPLTITFNDLSVNSLIDDLVATVYGPCGAIIGSAYDMTFEFDGNKIGTTSIVNSVATFNYAGFEDGEYALSGNIYLASIENEINVATISVALENIIDHIEFWVSTTGSDENGNGSESNPFNSIAYALKESTKRCRDIVIHISEGNYTGDLNTQLALSSASNITLIGAGREKTIFDGANANYFAKVTEGNNKVTITDLTITNMGAENVDEILALPYKNSYYLEPLFRATISPITVCEGANLYLNNVNIVKNRGGNAIIENYGNLVVDNSIIDKNGIVLIGVVAGTGGTANINNTSISNNFAFNNLLSADLLVINNSEIKNNFNLQEYSLTNGGLGYSINDVITIMENTIISVDGDNSSLKLIGYDKVYDDLRPTVAINMNAAINNISVINNYGSPLKKITGTSDGHLLAAFGFIYGDGGKYVNVYNSTFVNLDCLWGINTYGHSEFNFDGCIFDNLTKIADSLTPGEDSIYTISNSVFLNTALEIDRNRRADREDPNCIFENNYWGSNDKPVITFINPGNADSFEPESWIALVEENEDLLFKLTDGENVSAYEGALPAEISYVADENGDVIPVLNLAGTGYKLSVDENGSIVLNTTEPMKNIVPKVAVNETVFANDTIAVINDGSKFNAVFTNKWGDPLKDTNVSFIVGEKTINATTDANGTATFDIDFALGQYIVSVINPVTGQSIEKTISVITEETTFASDVNATYNDGSKFSAKFTDEFGVPLANTNVTFIVGEKTINATTDVNGTASFDIDLKLGIFNVDITNPVTSQKLSKIITVITTETISVSDVTATYGDAAKFATNFTDEFGKALSNVNVTFKVGENTINATTDANGTASFDVNFDAGKYNVTIVNPVTGQAVTKAITVNQIATKLSAAKVTTTYNVAKNLVITLTDANGKALSNVKVIVNINGKNTPLTTDKNGKAKYVVKLPAKTYTAKITYAGDNNHIKSSASVKVVVKKASPKMTAKAKTFKTKTKKYTIVLKDNKGKAMKKAKVTLTTKVKGKTVKLTVKTKNNGKATFNLKKLVKGKYTASVKFAGNKNFKATTKKVKITVKK